MALISQPGSDYQLTEITLDTGNARDIICLLLDVHAVLDHLWLDGTQPEITTPGHRLPARVRQPLHPARPHRRPRRRDHPADPGNAQRRLRHQPARPQPQSPPLLTPRPGGAKSKENPRPPHPEGGARSKENTGASWG